MGTAEHAPASQPIFSGAERRAFRRAPLDRPVHLETQARTATARSVDVGGGGISLRTDLSLALGEHVSVYFELPIGYGVETSAVVVRRESGLFALQFESPPYEAVVAVRSFCRASGLHPAYRTATGDLRSRRHL
ncbi:MAG: PilZ domain-containing protein [Polyangiaceae bacterium]